MTTATKITVTRILLIPLFVMMVLYYGRSVSAGHPLEWQRWAALIIFIVAAVSDGIDGYIARHFNQKSRLGEILDPIADKGLLLAGIISLSISGWSYEFPIWFPVLVIARDVIVVAGAIGLQLLNGVVHVKPSRTGKCATAFQMIALVLVMLQYNPFTSPLVIGPWAGEVHFLDLPVWIAGLFTAVSGVGYVADGIHQLHLRDHGDPDSAKAPGAEKHS